MTDHLLARVMRLTKRRLDPPREPSFAPSTRVLSWKPPAVVAHVTHYRIRLGADSSDPDYEVNAGHRSFPIPIGTSKVFLSAYNSAVCSESQKLELVLATLVPEVPDVKLFRAGTKQEAGTYLAQMYWDEPRLRMLTDLGVMAPDNRQNWAGVQFWVKKPKAGGGHDYIGERAAIHFLSFRQSEDGDYYYRETLATQPGAVPEPPEGWTFLAVSVDAQGELKRDGDGNPTGKAVTLQTLPKIDDVTSFTAEREYLISEGGQAVFRISGSWANLTTRRYKAVRVVMQGYGSQDEILAEKKDGENTYQSNTYAVPGQSTEVAVYAQTIFGDGTAKPITEDTPHVHLTIVKQEGDEGAEWCANVTETAVAVDYPATSDGTCRARVSTPFTPPDDARWGGVELVIWDGETERYKVRSRTSPVEVVFPVPDSLEAWSARVFSFDTNGRRNTYRAGVTPETGIAVGSAAGQLDFRKFLSSSVGASLGFLSQVFDLLEGAVVTGKIAAGAVIAEKIAAGAIMAVHITAGQVDTSKLTTGEIMVGGGTPPRPGKIGVYNASGVQNAFIGVEGGYDGAWFGKVGIGGTSKAAPVITADSTAVTINGAKFTLNLNGVTTTIDNAAVGGQYAGLKIALNSTGYKSAVVPSFFGAYNGSDVLLARLTGMGGYGAMTVYGSAGLVAVEVNGSAGGDVSVRDASALETIRAMGSTGLLSATGGFQVNYTTVIDSARIADFVSLKIGATEVIDSSRNVKGQHVPQYFTTTPTLNDGELAAYWDGSALWLYYKKGTNTFRVGLVLV